MWYRASGTKGANPAPKNIKKMKVFFQEGLESTLEELHTDQQQSIFDGTDTTPTIYKGNNSAIRAKSFENGPGVVQKNQPFFDTL